MSTSPMNNRALALVGSAALGVVLATMSGCASSPPPEPHNVSVEKHEQLARIEDKNAAEDEAKYKPLAATERPHVCDLDGPGPRPGDSVCWTTTMNPTQQYLTAAQQHRQAAAQHRAESEKLRHAEARACAGVPDSDRDISPFMHAEDIVGVTPLTAEPHVANARVLGAVVVFRPVRGMSEAWLQRVVDCHLARNDAMGHDSPEMPSCPLVPMGATAKVTATAQGFAVAIRSDDPSSAAEILRRARSLVASK